MNDRTALIRAILAHPSDDTPRLVYADWLDVLEVAWAAVHHAGKLIATGADGG